MKTRFLPSLARPLVATSVFAVFLGTAHAAVLPSFTVRSKTSSLPSMTRGVRVLAPRQVGVPINHAVKENTTKGGFRTVALANTAPTIGSVKINQTAPLTNFTLRITVSDVNDAEGDSVTLSYQWKKNGQDIPGQTGPTLNLNTPGNGDRGDQISVVVTASDGTDSSSKESSPVTVINSIPTVTSVTVTPSNPSTNSTLMATVVASDRDKDALTYTYEWRKNGNVIPGQTGPTLDLAALNDVVVGDTFTATATANDGTDNSPSITSSAVTVNNTAPTIGSVKINQTAPLTNFTLTLTVSDVNDAEGDSVTLSYQWKKNGQDIPGQTGPTLNLALAGNGDKGDVITVVVTASDGTGSSSKESSPVTVINSIPTVTSVTVTPSNPSTNSTLMATVVASDRDKDALTYTYEWRKNGNVIPGQTGPTLDLSVAGNGDSGDQISATVTANDGTADSTPVSSNVVTVVGTAPSITSVSINPSSPTTNQMLTTTVVATDAENDTLTYTYEWRKNGNVIPGQTGSTLDLSVAGNGDKGDVITVTVTANDGTADSTPLTSAGVTVANSAPTLTSVSISPTSPTTKETLTASPVATDADNDSLTYTYTWRNNGNVIPGETGSTLDLSKAGNGDKNQTITVEVTANDGTASSAALTSTGVTVINSAPTISAVTLSPTAPTSTDTLTATVTASDDDNDSLTYTYVWMKNGIAIPGETGSTLDLSKAGNGDDGDVITVSVTANDGTVGSTAITSDSVTVNNFLPLVVSAAPQGATDKVGDKRTFSVTMSDNNGSRDIKEMWLLINTRLNWSEGATFIYLPSASSPTSGLLYLRRGDAFLPPIQVGTGSSSSDVLDNGAVRVVGSEVTVSMSGNSITLNIPATIREGLVGQNQLFTRVVDRSGATDPNALEGDTGYIRSGAYTVASQFATAENSAPTLSKLSPGATYTALNSSGIAPGAQTFVFYVKDENGTSDLESVWFLAGKELNWSNSATFVYQPRTRRLFLRSDDGSTFLGGGQVGTTGIIENSQVKVDLSKVQVLIYSDGKSFGLRLPLQAKSGLLGQNKVWLRAQDNQGATAPNGDAQGFVLSGTWSVVQGTTPSGNSIPSGGNS